MELFENKVGRPSNEIRSKRRKFVASAVSLSLVAIFAITLAVKNVATSNLQGNDMGNNTGDIDGSGTVNYKDLDLALKHIAKIKTLSKKEIKYGDTNKDGKITFVDAKEILRKGNFGKVVGDVDNNKKTTDNDARQILRYAARLDTPNEAQKKAADMNGDRKITATDARLALIKVYGTETRKGDANGDGKVTEEDARLVLKYASKQKVTNEQKARIEKYCDINGDKRVTATDAQILLRATKENLCDVDGDGKVTTADAKLVLSYASRQKVTNEQKNKIEKYCDMNGDGKVTTADARILYKVPEGHVGDVDGDGKITFDDVTKVMNFVAKIGTLSKEQQVAADVDLNGKVEMKDAKALSLLIRNNTGDADGDGRVSKEDAKLVARYASKQKVTNEQKARIEKYCDMDGNKNITMSDARIIYRISQN